MPQVDVSELRDKIKAMYQAVAEEPHGRFHFEMGRDLARRLGYPPGELDRLPPEAVESFAGVGYHLARQAGPAGGVTGVDMTEAQLAKARRLAARDGYTTVRLELGYIEQAPVEDGSADVVISNGVINLCEDKAAVFREIARILKPGGRTAISDIVTELQLTEAIVCDASLWASCIGGAMQQDDYRRAIEDAGLTVRTVREIPQYQFISDSAQGATKTFGVKSISVLASKAD